MEEAFSGGWVDVYENEGKRSGAFSAGVYGVHPYMLLNYNETLDSFFTAAHEMGHTLHTMLSHENQPYTTSDYTIFVAEVASTLNERLLLDHMLAKAEDPLEKVALLTRAIDDIIGTFYSQVMFADFELQANKLVQDGVPITQRRVDEDLHRPVAKPDGRGRDLRRPLRRHLDPHLPFLLGPLLCLPVRHLLRLVGPDLPGHHQQQQRRAGHGGGPISGPARNPGATTTPWNS